MKSKKLYVVLVRTKTFLSNLIHFTTRDEYTHAAFSLDSNLEYMFSFGRRYANNPFIACFRREEIEKGLYGCHEDLPGIILELSVTECQYNAAKKIIENFLINSHVYYYDYIGLFTGIFGIHFYRQNCFLCSQFVNHVLSQSGVSVPRTGRGIVRPQDFLMLDSEVIYKGNLKEYDRTVSVEPVFKLLLANL